MPCCPPDSSCPTCASSPARPIYLHEEADERRVASLALRLQADGVMRNPPIVAALDVERYVVLDGANRVSALRRLGVPDLLVQVVDYHKVTLNTWYHLVTGTPTADFEQGLAAIPGLRLESATLEAARRRLAEDDCLAFVVHPDSDVTCLVGGEGLVARSAMLRDVVRLYKGRANIHRVQSDELEGLAPFYTEITGLVVFPSYQPADILGHGPPGRQDYQRHHPAPHSPTGPTRQHRAGAALERHPAQREEPLAGRMDAPQTAGAADPFLRGAYRAL